jgi:hypothetical protein
VQQKLAVFPIWVCPLLADLSKYPKNSEAPVVFAKYPSSGGSPYLVDIGLYGEPKEGFCNRTDLRAVQKVGTDVCCLPQSFFSYFVPGPSARVLESSPAVLAFFLVAVCPDPIFVPV